jgi:hypothetical protein
VVVASIRARGGEQPVEAVVAEALRPADVQVVEDSVVKEHPANPHLKNRDMGHPISSGSDLGYPPTRRLNPHILVPSQR